MVVRLLTNLKAVYLREADFTRAVRIIERLRQLLPDDPLALPRPRPLRAARRPARQGMGHLEGYLRLLPGAEDSEAVQQLLTKARRSGPLELNGFAAVKLLQRVRSYYLIACRASGESPHVALLPGLPRL